MESVESAAEIEFDTEFPLAADADTAWRALLDVPRVAPLLPGVVLDAEDGDEHRGRVKIKFGATTVTFKGTVRTAVLDDLTRTAILEAAAREARGPGTAQASFQATVLPSPTGSRVVLHTRATFTGRAATVPAPLVRETAGKLLARFAAALSASLAAPAPAPAPASEPEPAAVPEALAALITETVAAETIPAESVVHEIITADPTPEPLTAETVTAEAAPTEPAATPEIAPAEGAATESTVPETPLVSESVVPESAPEPAEVQGPVTAPEPGRDRAPTAASEPAEVPVPPAIARPFPGAAPAPSAARRLLPLAGALLALLVLVRAVSRRRRG